MEQAYNQKVAQIEAERRYKLESLREIRTMNTAPPKQQYSYYEQESDNLVYRQEPAIKVYKPNLALPVKKVVKPENEYYSFNEEFINLIREAESYRRPLYLLDILISLGFISPSSPFFEEL